MDSRVITEEGALFILQRPLNILSIQLRRLNRLKSLCIFLSVKTKYLILPKWTNDQSLNLIFFVLMIVVNKSVPRDIIFKYKVNETDADQHFVDTLKLFSNEILRKELDVQTIYRFLIKNGTNIQDYIFSGNG